MNSASEQDPSVKPLLRALLRRPADDEPRQQLAAQLERLGDARGSFIRLQLQGRDRRLRTHVALDDPPEAAALLKAHPGWAHEVRRRSARRWWFLGGFVEAVELEAAAYLKQATSLPSVAPVRHVWLTEAKGRLGEVLACPALRRLTTLGLRGNALDDADAQALASTTNLTKLVCLDLRDNRLTAEGVRTLVQAPDLGALRCVGLEGNPSGPLYVAEFTLQEIPHLEWLPTDLGMALAPLRWMGRFPDDFPFCLDLLASGSVPLRQ